MKARQFAGLKVSINTDVGIDVIQIVNRHAELMLFWSIELDLLYWKKQK